jgi:FkbM family methyltransferase
MPNPNVVISSDHGSLIININDFIGGQIAQHGYWARADIALMRQIIGKRLESRQRLRIYDVGANIGAHTLALAKLAPGRLEVRAFEAQRQIFYMLCGNVALNGLRHVHCHHLAVSNVSGQRLEIDVPDYDQPGNFGALELIPPVRSDPDCMRMSGTKEMVTTVKLDDYDEPVDFIKMDIEGMEDKALQGAAGLFRRHRPGCFLEIHKTDAAAVLAFFRSLDYVGFRVNKSDLIALPREDGITIGRARQVI